VLGQPAARMAGTLQLLLELCDSAITYQGRYMSAVQPGPVLDLVLADPDNPRALAFQFAQAAALLRQAGSQALAAEADVLLQRTATLVDGVVRAADPIARAAALPKDLLSLGTAAAALSAGVSRRFFALLPALQSVGFEAA